MRNGCSGLAFPHLCTVQTALNLQAHIALLNAELDRLELPTSPHLLYEPIRYFLSLGGKRLRPALLMEACALMGGNAQEAMGPALAVELFHNFTLLHDDIMDEAPLRRNQPTVHTRYNTPIAILSGDALFVLAYQQLLKTKTSAIPPLMALFNQTALEVCEGQQLDMDLAVMEEVSIQDYLQMIALKTSVLLAASLKMGAIIAGASQQDADLLYRFGKSLGIAFQIQDDILDIFGDPEKFGKQPGGDILSNKNTFLKLKAFEIANQAQKQALKSAYQLDAQNHAEEKVAKVTQLFEELGVKSITEREKERHLSDALEALDSVRMEEAGKVGLRTYSRFLVDREH